MYLSIVDHSPYLLRCLELARLPGAAVEPNPRVGAVVVHNGRIIGEGWHRQFGGPHAEVEAVAQVMDKALLPDATLYVSLEPCNHHGKTPPCTDLILRHGIRHVVIGSIDPNPSMGGKSVAMLRAAGVHVELASAPEPFVSLNKHFWCNQLNKRPFVLLKWAHSSDGFIAGLTKDGKPGRTAISGPESAKHVHWLRHMHQAILVGANTAITDDPLLDCRHWPGHRPMPILLDADCQVPMSAKVFEPGRQVMIVNRHIEKEEGTFKWIRHEGSIPALLERLYGSYKVGSVMVEGGREILMQFLQSAMADEIQAIAAPIAIGKGLMAPTIPAQYKLAGTQALGADTLYQYHLH